MVHGLLSRSTEADPSGLQAPVAQGIERRPSKPGMPVQLRPGVRPRDLGERFWSRVDRSQYSPGGCWEWTGFRTKKGYGAIQCGSRADGNRGPVQAHRAAYLLGVGPLAAGEVVRHRCNNPPCCNPAHLVSGTQFDNVQDMVDAERQAKGESNGNAKLSAVQVGEIRELRAAGCKTAEIGERYGVSQSLISQICRGVLWRHAGGARRVDRLALAVAIVKAAGVAP